ncbi:MAG TPA: hypothetical protein VHS28_11285 [Chloroflexota bacterium]|nr:hypothetical protein [Chloroflexota bacterium]
MPRRATDPTGDPFLKANLNDPDNQAALLRAYLDLKQTTADLSAKLAQAGDELASKDAAQATATQAARDAGQAELAQKNARLERMGEAMRLVKWAGEWASRGASFLVGARQDLGQLISVTTTSVESCREVRFDKASDTWILVFADGRPDTIIAPSGAKGDGQPSGGTRRRRTTYSGH